VKEEMVDTHSKALKINLDPRWYGTFAEIGAGQEVVRWFFRVGGGAGTIAKSISAYDMKVSDAIYGHVERYVSRGRLQAMLDREFAPDVERLGQFDPLPLCLIPLPLCLIPLPSYLIRLPSCLIPLPSCLIRLPSCLIPLPSCLIRLPSCLIPLPSYLIRLPSCLIRLPSYLILGGSGCVRLAFHGMEQPFGDVAPPTARGRECSVDIRAISAQ
jgi:hypothetical protein